MTLDETRRYMNPRTLLIENVTPSYAAQVGLLLWEGETAFTEVDKTDVERAVIAGPFLDDLKKPELVEYAGSLGLDNTGTAEDIRERITDHHDALCAKMPAVQADTEEVPVENFGTAALAKLPGNSAVGDDNDSQEG